GGAWQVVFARRLGGLAAGLSLRHGSGEHGPTPVLEVRRERDEFGLGARCDLGETAYLDLAGELVRLAQESTVDAGETREHSTFASYGLRSRGFVQVADGLVLVPVIEHRIEKRDLDPVLGSPSRRLWRLGTGLTWLPDPDHLGLLAVDWRDTRHATDGHATVTADVFEFRLAFEARIHALLSVRLASGYRHADLGTGSGRATARNDVPVSAGLAVHFGPADLDVALANLRPVGPDGLPEPWSTDDDATWLSAGLSWWF
ncbi:MAG: hypothetical protein IH621_00600, partial [Krumholzibacteria bacterium]|nr:hypothetical protein [Candidatus Krumholzibacteria bacterium]